MPNKQQLVDLGHCAYDGHNAFFRGTEQEVYKEIIRRGGTDADAVAAIRDAVDNQRYGFVKIGEYDSAEIQPAVDPNNNYKPVYAECLQSYPNLAAATTAFMQSDEYRDMMQDGMPYHCAHWIQQNCPEFDAEDMINELSKQQ